MQFNVATSAVKYLHKENSIS